MKRVIHSKIMASFKSLSIMRLQAGITPFIEKPSDKHENALPDVLDKVSVRINAVELFSLFTADVIKKEVFFTR